LSLLSDVTGSDNEQVLRTLGGGSMQPHGSGQAALQNLSAILKLSESTPAAQRIRVDPSRARGLSYYTGAIMEIAVPDLAGSLGGGGRYDDLIGTFLGEEVPAGGVSLGP